MNEWMRRILFLPPQSSTVATGIDHLHYFVIVTTMIGAVATSVVALLFVIRYRRVEGREKSWREDPAKKPPVWMEAGAVVFLLSLFVLWWVIGFTQYLRIRVAPTDTLDVYVTAKQWMWEFAYPDGNHTIGTLYVPAGRPVKLIMTSRDVIHSFYVPDFRIKQDVVPGRYTTVWFEVKTAGTHQLLCAEYCGTNHSVMRGEVVALAPADYASWVAAGATREQVAGPSDAPSTLGRYGPSQPLSLIRLGQLAAAQYGCLRCHTLDGSPYIAPTWAGLYGSTVPLADGRKVLADEAYITESMMDPLAKIHLGYNPLMPSYFGAIRPPETGAIIALIKSLRDVPPTGGPPAAPGAIPPPAAPAPATPSSVPGQMGEPPGQPKLRPELQPVPPPPLQAAPAEQGLPPPGAQVEPPPAGVPTSPPPRLVPAESKAAPRPPAPPAPPASKGKP